MPRGRYITVKIPEELAKVLDRFRNAWGYTSRAEMVDDAIRLLIVRMKGSESDNGHHPPASDQGDERAQSKGAA